MQKLARIFKLDLLIVTFLCVLFTMKAHAQTAGTDLANLLNHVKTMQANFTQTVYDNRNKAVQQSHGYMMLERPNKFRWDVKKPIPQLIIANQARLWIYDPDLEQVTIRALSQSTGETPALVLSRDNIQLDNDYVVSAITVPTSNLRWFKLVPKQADSMFASIQMGFNNDEIREMQLKDHLGHNTRIQFKDAKINGPISESSFVFKAPANVDVIDETRKKRSQ